MYIGVCVCIYIYIHIYVYICICIYRRFPLKQRPWRDSGSAIAAARGGRPTGRFRDGTGVASTTTPAAHVRARAPRDRGGGGAAGNSPRRHAAAIRLARARAAWRGGAPGAAHTGVELQLRTTRSRGQLGVAHSMPSVRPPGATQRAGRGSGGGRRACVHPTPKPERQLGTGQRVRMGVRAPSRRPQRPRRGRGGTAATPGGADAKTDRGQ